MDTNKDRMPSHISIIMDGNGRWAKKRSGKRSQGHKAGVEAVIKIVEHARKLKLSQLTLYAFSTENWKRPRLEVNYIMKLLVDYIDQELDRLIDNGVQIRILGNYHELPRESMDAVIRAIDQTKSNCDMILNIAINYGGRDEIIRACKKIAKLALEEEISIDEIDDELFQSQLYTAGQPDPDLMIRTGSEQRLSNFLTYQSVYTELYFTDILWPDFTPEDFDKAIEDYQKRQRRFGGLND